ncbi:nicotinamide N-methyltransferase-like [Dendropsophus ebraccatus]|uniref:nicotinamide N-methyltransferase-like n=1 Tax=Dendropsophus ebraccatus TaxID=150705 RepID=UPI003831DA7F
MTSISKNLYHVQDFDTRTLLDTYFSSKPDMAFGEDGLKNPLQKLHQTLIRGHITGTVLMDFSMGPIIHHLYTVCEFFNDIIIMRFKERCIMELNKWRYDRTGGFDWSHARDIVKQLEGKSNEQKELKLKLAIKQIVKCNLQKNNLIDPLDLPKADCVISAWLLDVISQNHEDYVNNLKKIVNFLKPGGYLILLGVLNGSYYMVGKEKFHVLTYDENFVKEALIKQGFIIDDCEVFPRAAKSDLTDYTSMMTLTAHKQ